MSTIPFSYYLYHIPTKKHYYGIKFSKGCNPKDLWVTYFSTSVLVKKLIQEYGADSFIVKIRKTFTSGKDALLWEHKVLRRLNAAAREEWLNRHNGGSKFRSPEHHSEKTKEILRRKITGMKRGAETKAKHSINSQKREAQRKKDHWAMPKEAIHRAIATRRARTDSGVINPYSEARNKKMGASKTGKKRLLLSCGKFIMI